MEGENRLKKSLIEYFNLVQQAYEADDSDRVEQLALNEGKQTATFHEVEEALASISMSLVAVIEENRQISEVRYDLLKHAVADVISKEALEALEKQEKEIDKLLGGKE